MRNAFYISSWIVVRLVTQAEFLHHLCLNQMCGSRDEVQLGIDLRKDTVFIHKAASIIIIFSASFTSLLRKILPL